MKKPLMIATAVLVMLTGCQKQNNENAEGQKFNQTMSSSNLKQSFDVAAIVDDIGVMHNRALASALDFNAVPGNGSWEAQVTFLQNYFKVPSDAGHQAIIERARLIAYSGTSPKAEEIIAQLRISLAAKKLLSAIIATTQQMQSADIELLSVNLSKIESQANHTLNSEEQLFVRQLASIAKYSAMFWKKRLEQYPLPDGGDPFLKWLAGLYADNCGCLVGILFGDPDFGAALFSASVGYFLYYGAKKAA